MIQNILREWDSPGGPVVKTPNFAGLIPGQELCASWPKGFQKKYIWKDVALVICKYYTILQKRLEQRRIFLWDGGVLEPILHAYEEQFCATGRITQVLYKLLSRRDNSTGNQEIRLPFPQEKTHPFTFFLLSENGCAVLRGPASSHCRLQETTLCGIVNYPVKLLSSAWLPPPRPLLVLSGLASLVSFSLVARLPDHNQSFFSILMYEKQGQLHNL